MWCSLMEQFYYSLNGSLHINHIYKLIAQPYMMLNITFRIILTVYALIFIDSLAFSYENLV